MPPRRTTARRNAGLTQQQSTLSFHGKSNRITKNTSPRGTKSAKVDPALLERVSQSDLKAEARPDTTAEVHIQDTEPESQELEPISDPLAEPGRGVKTEDVLGGRAPESDAGAVGGGSANSGWVGDEEQVARKLPETQIKRYWRQKESERLAPRVHQEDLGVHEKILREWDMSGQYGPCIGIARLKRWKRANLLGLKPPIEVLAVVLREMDGGDAKAQRAHVDELMNSRFTEA